MRDSVPSASYSSVCNVLRQWNISLIPTYRVYGLYDKMSEFIQIPFISAIFFHSLPQTIHLNLIQKTEVRWRLEL